MNAAIEIVFPVFAVMLAGWGFVRLGLIDQAGTKAISNFVFLLAIPALLFRTTAKGVMEGPIDWELLYGYYAAAAINFLLVQLIGWRLFRVAGDQRAVMGISVTFSNAVLIGIPLVQLAYGEQGLVPLLLLISIHAMVLITAATISLEISRGHGGIAAILGQTVRGLLTNPIVVALLLGLSWHQLALPLPSVVDSFCAILGSGAGPAALFAVGAGMAAIRLRGDLSHILTLTAMKLLLLPVWVWLMLSFVFEVRDDWLTVAVTMAALPIGANASLFAHRYGVYQERATGAVFLSTILSAFTLTFLLGFGRL